MHFWASVWRAIVSNRKSRKSPFRTCFCNCEVSDSFVGNVSTSIHSSATPVQVLIRRQRQYKYSFVGNASTSIHSSATPVQVFIRRQRQYKYSFVGNASTTTAFDTASKGLVVTPVASQFPQFFGRRVFGRRVFRQTSFRQMSSWMIARWDC